jgi:hypothetical protein
MRAFVKPLLVALLICLWTSVASASIMYNFQAFSSFDNGIGNVHGGFSLVVPTFISADSNFTPGQLTSASITGTDPNLALNDVEFHLNFFDHDMIGFGGFAPDGNNSTNYYYFDLGAFGAIGSYDTVLFGSDQAGHLEVRNTAATVPEPSTIFLLATGLAGLVLVRRRA